MPKHLDEVPALNDFRAPWETEAGTDAEIDKPKLRKYIHNLLTDKAKAQDSREEAKEAQTAAETEAAAQKKRADDASGTETAEALKKAEEDRDKYKAQVETFEAEKAAASLKAEVVGDLEPKYAKYVTGETKADLEASLAQVREDFDLPDPAKKGEDDDDDEPTPRRQPERLVNGRQGKEPVGGQSYDYDAVADDILAGSGW